MIVLGIDGWRDGWVGVRLDRGRFTSACVGRSLRDLIDDTDERIGIDIPLSFAVDGAARTFDIEARRRLRGRASTLFVVPSREVMEAEPYAAANALSRQRHGRGISKQVYNLRSKIFEAAELDDDRFIEVHPEVAFAEMAGEPLMERKKSWAGQQRRRALLRRQGVEIPDDVGPAGVVPPDDLLDAAAVAVAVQTRDLRTR